MRENDFLSWIQQQTPSHPRVPLGIGDDMAAVNVGTGLALLKIDQALDQVHFDLRQHSPAQAGRKAVNRCLSDCAAMACKPAALMISVALPRGSGEAFAQQLFLACRDAAAVFDCPLVGGDTSIWDQRLAITVAALGLADQPLVKRSGAKPGDTLFVSGSLGGSILGRHLNFVPRIDLAQKLVRAVNLHAMMDLSDGLAQDVPRLARASGLGATLYPHLLPVHPDAETLSEKDGVPPALHALADGEDYELLFAIDPEDVVGLVDLSERGGIPLTAIGTLTAEKTLHLEGANGQRLPWPRGGWEHAG